MEERNRPSSDASVKRRRHRRTRRKKMSPAVMIIIFLVIVAGVIGGAFLIKRYGPSKTAADLKEYYGIKQDDQLAVVYEDEVLGAKGKMYDNRPYVEYSVVHDYLNRRFYVDLNENILLYTLPDGTLRADVGSREYSLQKDKTDVGYPIFKMDGNTAYIALSFVQEYTNIDFSVYDDPSRVMITGGRGKTTVATVKRNTQVRYLGGVKSPILKEVSKNDIVTVLQDVDGWKKVCTEDGIIGYMKSSCLKKEQVKERKRAFEEPKYTNISKNYTINLAWHVVTNRSANDSVLSTIAGTKGLNTISPTWFTVSDTGGNLNSLASQQYVNYAHQSDIEVWAMVKDFDGGIGSTDETYELLSHTKNRENLINQLVAEALKTGIDGINVDFEHVSSKCGEHFIQFIRELSVRCRQNAIVLSVDNYVPKDFNRHYDLQEQGIVADYVIIMGYDEHYADSYESGPVASLEFVRDGIEATLKDVPAEKTVNAVPFYTRIWKEVPKTEEELSEQAGTEAEKYPLKVTSKAYGMAEAEKVITAAGAQISVDPETGQNYAQWEADGGTYKVWLEDEYALEAKLKLIKSNKLAGVAEWRLGFEKPDTWDLILKYVN